jgi:hypothetical protein
MTHTTKDSVQHESRSDTVTHLLEECRMVLPGIQALFGFQLIAVFNAAFWEKLHWHEQCLHLAAIGLVAISVALVMTPAAYHRQAEPETISKRFISLSTKLLAWSMVPLMFAIALEVYIIGRLILENWIGSLLLSSILVTIFMSLWFILPRFRLFRI